MYEPDISFDTLKGKTLKAVTVNPSNDVIEFETTEGESFRMYHSQDCCESVSIEDIEGDLKDLVGSPILQAEENSNSDQGAKSDYDDAYTWTFYRLSTAKGGVVMRWYGSSNGYYSTSVSFSKLN